MFRSFAANQKNGTDPKNQMTACELMVADSLYSLAMVSRLQRPNKFFYRSVVVLEWLMR